MTPAPNIASAVERPPWLTERNRHLVATDLVSVRLAAATLSFAALLNAAARAAGESSCGVIPVDLTTDEKPSWRFVISMPTIDTMPWRSDEIGRSLDLEAGISLP